MFLTVTAEALKCGHGGNKKEKKRIGALGLGGGTGSGVARDLELEHCCTFMTLEHSCMWMATEQTTIVMDQTFWT